MVLAQLRLSGRFLSGSHVVLPKFLPVQSDKWTGRFQRYCPGFYHTPVTHQSPTNCSNTRNKRKQCFPFNCWTSQVSYFKSASVKHSSSCCGGRRSTSQKLVFPSSALVSIHTTQLSWFLCVHLFDTWRKPIGQSGRGAVSRHSPRMLFECCGVSVS